MRISLMFNGLEKFFSNSRLKVGDKVYPIVDVRLYKGKIFITGMRDLTEDFMHGYPDRPHTIMEYPYKYATDLIYEIRTDKGFGPAEQYFKEINEKVVYALEN